MKTFGLVAILTASFIFNSYSATYDQELSRLSSELGAALQKENIKTVAILNFKDLQGKETDLGKLLASEMPINFVNQKQGFSVVDRSILDRIMNEQKMTEEGLIKPENSRKLKLAGIDALIYGTIIPFDDSYRINVMANNTESATLVAGIRGNIAQGASVDALMGAQKSQTSSFHTDTPVASKKKVYDLGGAIFEIKNVELIKKQRKIRVVYSVIVKNRSHHGMEETFFTYRLHGTEQAYQDPYPDGYNLTVSEARRAYNVAGEATDNEGSVYKVVTRSSRGSCIKITPGSSLGGQIEYQWAANEGGSAFLPKSASFSFEFYGGYPGMNDYLFRVFVSDYAFDRIQ